MVARINKNEFRIVGFLIRVKKVRIAKVTNRIPRE